MHGCGEGLAVPGLHGDEACLPRVLLWRNAGIRPGPLIDGYREMPFHGLGAPDEQGEDPAALVGALESNRITIRVLKAEICQPRMFGETPYLATA